MPDTTNKEFETLFNPRGPSDEWIIANAYFEANDKLSLVYEATDVNGTKHECIIKFPSVGYYSTRISPLCLAWHFEAFDSLKRVKDSQLLKEVSEIPSNDYNKLNYLPKVNHYIIYFGDDEVFFEAVATGWEAWVDGEMVASGQ